MGGGAVRARAELGPARPDQRHPGKRSEVGHRRRRAVPGGLAVQRGAESASGGGELGPERRNALGSGGGAGLADGGPGSSARPLEKERQAARMEEGRQAADQAPGRIAASMTASPCSATTPLPCWRPRCGHSAEQGRTEEVRARGPKRPRTPASSDPLRRGLFGPFFGRRPGPFGRRGP
jgi:hypothetical protein